jgi:hypothetical protein
VLVNVTNNPSGVTEVSGAVLSGQLSTVARLLAASYGLTVDGCEPSSAHRARSNPTDDPLLHAFLAMDMDE